MRRFSTICHSHVIKKCLLVSKFALSISRTLQSKVFFSSTATLFDDALEASRELVKTRLKEQGFTGILNTTSSFNKNDLRALKVSFKPALKCDILPCDIEGTNYAVQHSF